MSDEFEVRWQVEDGYVGGARPQDCDLSELDIEDNMSDEDLRELLYDTVRYEFEANISFFIDNESEALEWMRQKRDEKAAECS